MCDFNCKDCRSFFCSTKPNFKTETTKQIGKEIFVWALKDPAFWCLLEIWRNTHDRNYGDKYISRNFEETRLKLNPMTISTLKKMSHLNFFIFILKKESNWEGEWTLLNVATFLRALKEYFLMTLYLPLPPPIEMVEIKKKIVSDHHPCLNLFYTGTDALISYFHFFQSFLQSSFVLCQSN